MPVSKKIFFILVLSTLFIGEFLNSGCGIYKFQDVSIPDSIKTVRVQQITENRGGYVNPQLSPQLTDKLRQKIVNQTRLTQVNNENAHYDITGAISQYTVSTSAISGQQSATNRLTVGVRITLRNQLENTSKDFNISRSFEFSATLTLPQAEAGLKDEMIRTLVDEIFNSIFSNWSE